MRKLTFIALPLVGLGGTEIARATETITYTYDVLGRLVTVVHAGTVNNGQQTVYTLDSADNRTNVTTTGAPH